MVENFKHAVVYNDDIYSISVSNEFIPYRPAFDTHISNVTIEINDNLITVYGD